MRDAQFSPDGKWIAYWSNESSRFEIYVQPVPGPVIKRRVSTNGGAQVRWRQTDSTYQAVEVAPQGLFTTHVDGAVQGVNRQQYMVSSQGQRFLMNTVTQRCHCITDYCNFELEAVSRDVFIAILGCWNLMRDSDPPKLWLFPNLNLKVAF